MIDAIFFDWDGTLMDDESSCRRAVLATSNSICQRLPGVDGEVLLVAYYKAAEEIWDQIKNTQTAPWGNMDDYGVACRVWNRVIERLRLSVDGLGWVPATIWTGVRQYDVPIFDDVIPCLDALRGHYRLGVVTNGSIATHLPKIEVSGLRDYFASITTTDIGAAKPCGAIFAHALESLDTTPTHALYVGDWPFGDVGGANRAGMTSVWLNRRKSQLTGDDPVPDLEIRSLDELTAAIKGL